MRFFTGDLYYCIIVSRHYHFIRANTTKLYAYVMLNDILT